MAAAGQFAAERAADLTRCADHQSPHPGIRVDRRRTPPLLRQRDLRRALRPFPLDPHPDAERAERRVVFLGAGLKLRDQAPPLLDLPARGLGLATQTLVLDALPLYPRLLEAREETADVVHPGPRKF